MGEDRTAKVEEPVDTEFQTGTDDPAKGAEVVICDVGEEEGIIRTEGRSRWGLVGGVAEKVKEAGGGERSGGVWERGWID